MDRDERVDESGYARTGEAGGGWGWGTIRIEIDAWGRLTRVDGRVAEPYETVTLSAGDGTKVTFSTDRIRVHLVERQPD